MRYDTIQEFKHELKSEGVAQGRKFRVGQGDTSPKMSNGDANTSCPPPKKKKKYGADFALVSADQ